MNTPKLRDEIKKAIDGVPGERLASLADYVHFLSRPPIVDEIEKAEKAIAAGKGVSWRAVRNDV